PLFRSKACFQQHIRFVHISTDHLFSGDKELITEEEPVAPLNVYAQTKAEAEVRVLGSNPDSLVIRTNFYGWGTSYRQSFSDYIIKNISEGNNITLYRDVFYSPIFTSVLAKTVHDLVELNVSGIYNVVGDERISKYEFGLKVASIFQLDPILIKPGLMAEQGSVVRRPYDMSLSNNKTIELLGRKLGGVGGHLDLMKRQQTMGLAQEIQRL
ncbi:MAG TPA: NAD-dependent epimerase/dehydratase family protein, partial [candidate division Zixibacteria bacterium]|nr:NAD-dependent epimerase/dehydratase family protein [candidate division Zixibacteria bacterium]